MLYFASMDQLLLNQLIDTRYADIAGVGRLRLQYTPARYQVADREFSAPQQQLEFEAFGDSDDGPPDQRLIASVARLRNMSEEEAYEWWSETSATNRSVLQSGKTIDLGLLGRIAQVNDQAVYTAANDFFAYPVINAERVIRADAVHAMKVGDSDTDSRTMEEWLQTPDEKPSRWWVWPLILAAIALLLIVLAN